MENERIFTPAEHQRHYEPIKRELHPDDAKQFEMEGRERQS